MYKSQSIGEKISLMMIMAVYKPMCMCLYVCISLSIYIYTVAQLMCNNKMLPNNNSQQVMASYCEILGFLSFKHPSTHCFLFSNSWISLFGHLLSVNECTIPVLTVFLFPLESFRQDCLRRKVSYQKFHPLMNHQLLG